jgi:hypothetical protein
VHGRRLGGKRIVLFEPEQHERVACSAVQRAEAAVVVVLPPESVVPLRARSAAADSCATSSQRGSPVQSRIARAASSVPGAPHITSSVAFETLARTSA